MTVKQQLADLASAIQAIITGVPAVITALGTLATFLATY